MTEQCRFLGPADRLNKRRPSLTAPQIQFHTHECHCPDIAFPAVCVTEDLHKLAMPGAMLHSCESCPLRQAVPTVFGQQAPMQPKGRFVYFTGTNRGTNDNRMIELMLKTMRMAGVSEDLHVFSTEDVPGAINHRIKASLPWNDHLAKADFARQLVDLDIDFVVWLDTDNFFVRHPGDLSRFMRDNPMWYGFEADMTIEKKTKEDGWYNKKHSYVIDLFRAKGVTTEKVWSGNGGLYMLRRDAINDIVDEMHRIHNKWKPGPWPASNDEVILACLAAKYVKDPELNTADHFINDFWACDWADVYKHQLPRGEAWTYTDWMYGWKRTINPAIVHCMRSKHLMWAAQPAAAVAPVIKEPVGTRLTEIIKECGVVQPEGCSCRSWAEQMDRWGIQGCNANRKAIIRHLNDSSSKSSWLDMLKVAAKGYTSTAALLDEAIRRAA